MPELPEVETTKIVLEKMILNQIVKSVIIYQPKLRWQIPAQLSAILPEQTIIAIKRIAKYLLIKFNSGTLLIHLGMSGSLSVVSENKVRNRHEHFVLNFKSRQSLRLKDPRRFGAVLWVKLNQTHPLLTKLGVEPLSRTFNSSYLYQKTRKTLRSIKTVIMDSHIVVGIGNIYALESLFLAKISPLKPAKELNNVQIEQLVYAIKNILSAAIKQGGTTLKDFKDPQQRVGYFAQKLLVYGRSQKKCHHCSDIIFKVKQNGRSSYYCPTCQN